MSDYAHSSPTLNPVKFHLRLDPSERASQDGHAPIVIGCVHCPKWSAKTTVGQMRERYESHARRVHGGNHARS